MSEDYIELYTREGCDEQVAGMHRDLQEVGAVPVFRDGQAHHDAITAGAHLVREHISTTQRRDDEAILERMVEHRALPTPFLPDQFKYAHQDDDAYFSWIDPRLIVSNYDLDDRQLVEALDWVHWIRDSGADGELLARAFGPVRDGGPAHIDVQGWFTPAAPIYRIWMNGRHRVHALAALGAPCVLARVHYLNGPFMGEGCIDNEDYYQLLNDADIAPGRRMDGIRTSDWPILMTTPDAAVASLRALEARAGGRYADRIGDLPRSPFDHPDTLRRLATKLARGRRRFFSTLR